MGVPTRIAIVGNCQARPLAEMLARAVKGLDLPEPIIIHLARPEEAAAHHALLDSADHVLTQLVADNYPVEHLRTELLRARFGERLTVWPNVFFRGQNPDLVYVTHASGRLVSPMGHYHSRAVYTAWREGVPLDALREEDYASRSREPAEFLSAVERSFEDLRTRERETDVGIADEIARRWQGEPLFHTFNHPRATLLAELARRVAARLGLPLAEAAALESAPDRLGTVRPPMESALARALGLEFEVSSETLGVETAIDGARVTIGKPARHAFPDFARLSYACYDAQARPDDEVRFTPAP